MAKFGRRVKGWVLFYFPVQTNLWQNCFHSFLNISASQSLIFVISCTCAVRWWMPSSLYPLQGAASLQKSKNLEDQSLWYLINLHIFLRPGQCVKSVTSSFPYFIQYSLNYTTIVVNTAFSMVEEYQSWDITSYFDSSISPPLVHKKICHPPKYYDRLQKVPLVCRENDPFFCTCVLHN